MQSAKAVTWRKRLWEKQGKGRRQGLLACLRLYLDPSLIRLHPHLFHPEIVDMKCSRMMSAIRRRDRNSSSTDTESCCTAALALVFTNQCKTFDLGSRMPRRRKAAKARLCSRPKAPSPGSKALPASCVPCLGFGASVLWRSMLGDPDPSWIT